MVYMYTSMLKLPSLNSFKREEFMQMKINYTINIKKYKYRARWFVATHDTRIREIPGSNPVAGQPSRGFYYGFLNLKIA